MKFLFKIIIFFLIINCVKTYVSNSMHNKNVNYSTQIEEMSNLEDKSTKSNNFSTNQLISINEKNIYIVLNKTIDLARVALNLFENTLNALENNQSSNSYNNI